MQNHFSYPRRALILVLAFVSVLALGLMVVSANPLVQSDKRLNQITDFGGDALYCVDDTFQPTNDSKTFYEFRLLNSSGQELWTLSRATVEEGLGQIKYGGNPVLLGEGHGTFGEINLYGNAAEDGSPYFIFMGFDDHYKPNLMIFYGCTPVGSPQAAPVEPTPTLPK
ncbi:MAG TPA: hypothetical protein VHD90_28415 [Phototrophicaceae bacterium]|nr:hypothetical protein [Phototrophicaceae bacterium]